MRLNIYTRKILKLLYLFNYLRNPFKIKNYDKKYPVEYNFMFLNYFIKSLLRYYMCVFVGFWCKLGCGVN